MFANLEEMLPVISFGPKSTTEAQTKHTEFVNRMTKKGYSPQQIRRLVDWYVRVQKSS